MSATDNEEKLKFYWEHFFKAETGTYEKSTWLDLFLAEFIIRINEGANPKELIHFCPISGVVTLVGCELLCGIHRVTSSINTHYTPPVPILDGLNSEQVLPTYEETNAAGVLRPHAQSSSDILRKYLLNGVAWRCLIFLKALGVEGLSCCRQLSSVLIWLCGELGGSEGAAKGAPPNPHLPRAPDSPPIYQLFSNRIWSKQKVGTGQKAHVTSTEKTATSRSKKSSQTKNDTPDSRRLTRDVSSESADSDSDLQVLNRSLTLKVTTPHDFDYFNSPTKSEDLLDSGPLYSDPYFTPKKTKPKADDYMTDKHKEVINSEISNFEFTLIITDLLQELCKAESSLSGSEGSQISVQCINFSLRNLCSLQFGSMPLSSLQYNVEQISRIKTALTELLMVSLDKVLVRSDLCAKLINNGILPMLLRILEDVVCKSNARFQKDGNHSADNVEKYEPENLLKFVFGIAYSIAAFFYCLLMQCRSVDKLREFTDQFKLYGECLKGALLKDCIDLMITIPKVQDEAVLLIKKLIESVGKLISCMKRVRSEVIHSAACPRGRHKGCRGRVAAGMHHHHDILGDSGASPPLSSHCCISVLYGTLTTLLSNEQVVSRTVLRNRLLRAMLASGLCCCFSAGSLMEHVVRLMLTRSTASALCLRLLEHTVYGELGASILISRVTDRLPCSVCEPNDRNSKDFGRTKFYTHSVERKTQWSFLIHYNSLLQLDNDNKVLHASVGHLLRVTPRCRTEVKHELLFSVIYPSFIVAKHRYMIRSEESAYFLTASCLNMFSSLLNTVTFAEQFIRKGGLSYVLELVALSEFSKQCCAILEIAITVEIIKLTKDNSAEMSYVRDVGSLTSVQMLMKSIAEATDRCYKIYRVKLPADAFEEITDVTSERTTLGLNGVPSSLLKVKKTSSPIAIQTSFACSENVVEEEVVGYIEAIRSSTRYWRSCAGLCLRCPLFRQHVARSPLLLDSYVLLKLMLHDLREGCEGKDGGKLQLKMIEALLTTQFAVTAETAGRSNTASCAAVRAGLRRGAYGRAVCDALLRVAHAQPRSDHHMPAPQLCKMPALSCSAESVSSLSRSSSEESLRAPYASEHSDPGRPDLGYEADVEISKLNRLSNHKSKKQSDSASCSPTFDTTPEAPAGVEKYGGGVGMLAHPDLCLIVVDILTQLIEKAVSNPSDRESISEAQKCSARLSTSLCRAPAAILSRVLDAAKPLLAETNDALQDLQRTVLQLIEVLATLGIEPSELSQFLQLFKNPRPPLSLLLSCLQRICDKVEPNTPQHVLAFPVKPGGGESEWRDASDLGFVVVGSGSQSRLAETRADSLREQHLAAGIESAWSCSAFHCGIEGAGWTPWLQGFAAILWLRCEPRETASAANSWQQGYYTDSEEHVAPRSPRGGPPEDSVDLQHLFSIGQDSLLFETWIDVSSGMLTFRLTRPDGSGNKLVSSAQVMAVTAHRWTCLAMDVRNLVHKGQIHIQVTVYVNGFERETISLPLTGILVRKIMPTSLLVGAVGGVDRAGGTDRAAWYLGGVQVLRAPSVGACAPARAATPPGPPAHTLTLVDRIHPNYALIITPEILKQNINWDQVFETSTARCKEMEDILLLSFNAQSPKLVLLYNQNNTVSTVFSTRPVAPPPGGGPPSALLARWRACPLPLRHRGVATALRHLGGPDIFVFLFARVVELGGSPEEQARALSVLLQLAQAEGHGASCLDALEPALCAAHCTTHIIQSFLSTCCTESPLTTCGNRVRVTSQCVPIVRDPAPLLLLMSLWKHMDNVQCNWEIDSDDGPVPRSGSLWSLTLHCFRELLHPTAQATAFNRIQLNRVGLLHRLFTTCKERFLNSDCPPLDAESCENIAAITRGLLGTPPLLSHLALITDFLLLMHQASDTFVTHSRANFYFLLTPETQETSEYTFLNFMSRKKHSRRSKRKSNSASETSKTRSTASSVNSEDVSNENSMNALKEITQSKERDGDIEEELSVDSTKQLKGLINMKIKKGRLHNVSTTSLSEASDVAPGECEGSDVASQAGSDVTSRVEGALTEYVVVDLDDVTHTTVEMYSSGIFQQRRVRAGADGEGGGDSLCEGLLLLLHDAINSMSEHEITQGVIEAIQPWTLVVVGNARSGALRAALVRALAALQRRAPLVPLAAPQAPPLAPLAAHVALANQISLYPCTWELAMACAAMLTKCDVPLEDQLDDDIWMDMGEDWTPRAAPLLGALLATQDVPLAHNLTLFVRRIIEKASLKAISDLAVMEVVIKCIRAVGGNSDLVEGKDLLLDDFYELLNRIAVKALATQHSMQTINEIHYMLAYVEAQAINSDDEELEEVPSSDEHGVWHAARDAQCHLCIAQLNHLDNELNHAQPPRQTNYFTSVLSSSGTAGEVSRSEACARRRSAVTKAVSLLLPRGQHASLSPVEVRLHRLTLTTLLSAVSTEASSGNIRGKWWGGAVVGTNAIDYIPLLHDLLCWTFSGARITRPLVADTLRILYQSSESAQNAATPTDPVLQKKLSVLALCSLQRVHLAGSGTLGLPLPITDWARCWLLNMPRVALADELREEAVRLARADRQRWIRTYRLNRDSVAKAVFRLEPLAQRTAEHAMATTRRAVDAQNAERKRFMQRLRHAHTAHAHAQARLKGIRTSYTHERGVWHFPASYPRSWALDPTETAGRVRVRLRRAHLAFPQAFLKESRRSTRAPPPLSSVLCRGRRDGTGPGAGVTRAGAGGCGRLDARLAEHETVLHMCAVLYVTVATDTPGELLLSDRAIHFVPEESDEEELAADEEGPKKREKYFNEDSERLSWPLDQIVSVHTRRWCLREVAVEVFLQTGHAHLLAFKETADRDAFLAALLQYNIHAEPVEQSLQESMSLWRQGSLTNWEYLMRLNGLAGRTYNDLMQYPVFPFVVADYTSRILNLEDPATFRDFSKPMAVQNKKREQHYINTYNDLCLARREGCSALVSRAPHHYASLYSNSGAVLHYLVRLPPFTELFLNYQDNNFDMPDRTFHSLATTWRLITQDSPTDVKELIPELFFLPELFKNCEGLNLGVRQCGAAVDDVELPPWAAGDPRLFTLIHRQALESPVVREQLSQWIDLVFGYKQTGQAAIDAINVFPACTYYGFEPSALSDALERKAAEAMVRTYGQAPRQLLRSPHPRCLTDLARPDYQCTTDVWSGVSGARWGEYCGSPALPLPVPQPAPRRARAMPACPAPHGPPARLQCLPTPRSAVLPPANSILVRLYGVSHESSKSGVPGAALVSWGGADRVLRLSPPAPAAAHAARAPLLAAPYAGDQITVVSTSCLTIGCPIFIGYSCGRISVLVGRPDAATAPSALKSRSLLLQAHTASISDINVCSKAGLVVTASVDGVVVLWDLNKLTYIRTLPNRDMLAVSHATISETLCDVATVHDLTASRDRSHRPTAPPSDKSDMEGSDSYEKDNDNYRSLIRVHTVNATFVGSVKVAEKVTCVCYSNAPEGVSVNSIAAGLETGAVRLYSSWDLRPVNYIASAASAPSPGPGPALVSIIYSVDSDVLFGWYADGSTAMWEPPAVPPARPRPAAKLLPAHKII